MKLSVIIVNYNVKYYLDQCLRSVGKAIEGLDAEVLVVDNHSHDGSVEFLASDFPWVTFIQSHHNLGFARGNNLAIRQSRGEYVLLLNPDTLVGEAVLRDALAFMDAHPRAGGAGVRMLRTDGTDAMESRRGIPTPMTSLCKMVGLCARFPQNRVLGKYYMGYLPWGEPARMEIMSGAFCLLRRQTLDEVGLLDEDFFMYGEDIDLSYRILKAGWENWYLPLRILHYKGESTEKTNFRYVHVFYEAMFIFLRKHYGHLSWVLSLPIHIGIYLKASLALVSTIFGKIRYSLGFVGRRRARTVHYVFDVSEDHREACRRLATTHGLSATFVNEQQQRPCYDSAAADVTTYYVYDLSKFTFAEILEHLAAHSASGQQIAIYNPDRRVLVTDSEIIQ